MSKGHERERARGHEREPRVGVEALAQSRGPGDVLTDVVADAVGRSRAAVSNLLRLLELAEEVKALVERRQLEMGHARALLGLGTQRQQIEVALLVAKKGLSVRETEALVRRLSERTGETAGREPPRPDPNVSRLEQDLQLEQHHRDDGGGCQRDE